MSSLFHPQAGLEPVVCARGSLMLLRGDEEHLGFKKLCGLLCSAALLPGDAVPGKLTPGSFPETPFPAQQLEWILRTHPDPAESTE